LVVQPVGRRPRRHPGCRLALDGDAIRAVIRRAGNRVIPAQFANARHVQREAEILAGLVAEHRAAVRRHQGEGTDDAAFIDDTLDDEVAPAVPAARLCRQFAIDRGFPPDEKLCQEPVGLAPGGDDVVGGSVPQDVPDCAQQGVGDEGIVLRQDVQRDMLLDDAFDGAAEGSEMVDVAGIGQDCHGQRLGLRAGLAMVGLVEQVADRLGAEQAVVHPAGDGKAVRLKRGNGGLDDGDCRFRKGSRHLWFRFCVSLSFRRTRGCVCVR
jgi:hypothetical protein